MPDTLDYTTYTYGGLSYIDETDGGIYGDDWGLGPSTSYATRAQIVDSAQGQALLSDISWNDLLRPFTSAETTSAENSIVQGASFEDVIYEYSHSAEASNDISNIYNQLLIRAPTGTELQSGVATLQANGSLSEIRHSVAYSAEAQSDLNASYEAVLNRAGDTGGIANYQAVMAGGQSQQNVRADLANSTETLNDLRQVIQNVQGRTSNANDIPWIQGQINSLGNGTTTMSSVIYNLASGSGETPILQQVIQNVQGRVANASDTSWINGQIQRLENGTASIAQITYELASGSGETPILQQVIQNVQGRVANANDTPWIQGQITSLQNGTASIASITYNLASGSGETPILQQVIQNVQGRVANANDTAWIQTQIQSLENGTASIASITSGLASLSTPVLQQVIQNVQGRVANANDAPWIQGQIQSLENGSATIASITYNLASGSGETPILQQVIENVQGRVADANDTPWIQNQIQSLEHGTATINSVTSALAYSPGEQTLLDDNFSTLLGQSMPGTQLSTTEQSLASGGNTLIVAAQMVSSSVCYQDCLSELGQVEDTVGAAIDAPREQSFILQALQAASNTWASAIPTVESAAMTFLNQINPIGSADASTLSPAQRYATDLALSTTPNVKAMLSTITYCEGGGDVSFGGAPITDLSKFPSTGVNSASGLYQIVRRTYNAFASKLGITDISHTSQTVVATEMLNYQGVVSQLQGGNVTQALYMAAGVGGLHWNAAPGNGQLWAALPGGQAQQCSLSQALSFYHSQGGTGN